MQSLIIVVGYIITISTSGLVVRHFIGKSGEESLPADYDKSAYKQPRYDIGTIIGKCENIITITLILTNAFTGLALVFLAKSLIRVENMRRDPRYYLGGTLVNFSYSLIMGLVIRGVLSLIGHPL